ncbi:nitric oxide-sensing protein NosP [Arenibaculum pallidiluteum]|uniref:nitric oxide-sensing protein NosP n=1 Tax=Arenibaculum pallidiluteum TaxID=2812559 RepID=UPI001F2A0CB7|nr:nitric oxide-sensing protein NosP [Arenibaculum pallidiluteum]
MTAQGGTISDPDVQPAQRPSGARIRRGSTVENDPRRAAAAMAALIGGAGVEIALVFFSPDYDLPALAAALVEAFGDVPVIGCTTAGEIGSKGYLNGGISGLGFPKDGFAARVALVENLSGFEVSNGRAIVHELLGSAWHGPTMRSAGDPRSFAVLLVDGTSTKEEMFVSAMHAELGDIPLVGGSAGDGLDFRRSFVLRDGQLHSDAALALLLTTPRPFRVFQAQHFVPTAQKMVVTDADPIRRIVREINAEPAAEEYARLVGLAGTELTPSAFANHPVVVRVGGKYFVRAIQKVNTDGSLTFYCAIDTGVVLTVAQGGDLVENLESLLASLHAEIGSADAILAFDCILRRIEIEQKQLTRVVSRVLARNAVMGFSTYGEQYNGMHLSQTITGVAIGAA